jgi:hypothetical protein
MYSTQFPAFRGTPDFELTGRIGAGVLLLPHFGGPHTSSRHTVAAVQHGRSGSFASLAPAPASVRSPPSLRTK